VNFSGTEISVSFPHEQQRPKSDEEKYLESLPGPGTYIRNSKNDIHTVLLVPIYAVVKMLYTALMGEEKYLESLVPIYAVVKNDLHMVPTPKSTTVQFS
jgi:hypothetical protein